MVSIPLRRATPEDAAICARIISDWIERTIWMPRTLSQSEIAEIIKDALPMREITLIGAPPMGYLSLNPDTGMIGAIYLDKRGQGLGRMLLEHAKHGRDFLQLWTHEPNLGAQRFYEREGFQQVERNPEGNDGVAELRMEWHR